MLNRVEKMLRGVSNPEASSVTPIKKTQVGRERLKNFEEQIALAHNAIEDLEQRIARFDAIVDEAKGAERELQDIINSDGGVALAAFAAGLAKPNDPIVKLIAHAKSSAEAADAAKVAPPRTQSMLEDVRAQLVALITDKNTEINAVLASLADIDGQAYSKAFDELCILHDRLVGYSETAQSTLGDLRLTTEPLRAPRFVLPSMGGSDHDPFLRHSPGGSSLTIAASAKRWSEIKSRLENDATADVNDLLVS
jgi:hypothetical protein